MVRLLCLIVDDRHLPLPLLPNLRFSNQISHEVTDIDAAGFARIEDRASSRRDMEFKFSHDILIDQTVGPHHHPLDSRSVQFVYAGSLLPLHCPREAVNHSEAVR